MPIASNKCHTGILTKFCLNKCDRVWVRSSNAAIAAMGMQNSGFDVVEIPIAMDTLMRGCVSRANNCAQNCIALCCARKLLREFYYLFYGEWLEERVWYS